MIGNSKMLKEVRSLAEGKLKCECGNDNWEEQFLFISTLSATSGEYVAGCKRCGRTYQTKGSVWVLIGGPATLG